jgi:phosphoribosyl 1,2-cyclic phosphodiesterase
MAKRPTRRKSPSRPKRRPADAPTASQASQQPAIGTPTTATTATSPAPSKITIRFYCQGIGDCHLLKFIKEDGGFFWMLIDCGIHSSITGGPTKIGQIVDDIASATKRLDVIVLTHEHWDHNSGFFTARDKFKQFSV